MPWYTYDFLHTDDLDVSGTFGKHRKEFYTSFKSFTVVHQPQLVLSLFLVCFYLSITSGGFRGAGGRGPWPRPQAPGPRPRAFGNPERAPLLRKNLKEISDTFKQGPCR